MQNSDILYLKIINVLNVYGNYINILWSAPIRKKVPESKRPNKTGLPQNSTLIRVPALWLHNGSGADRFHSSLCVIFHRCTAYLLRPSSGSPEQIHRTSMFFGRYRSMMQQFSRIWQLACHVHCPAVSGQNIILILFTQYTHYFRNINNSETIPTSSTGNFRKTITMQLRFSRSDFLIKMYVLWQIYSSYHWTDESPEGAECWQIWTHYGFPSRERYMILNWQNIDVLDKWSCATNLILELFCSS